MYEMLNTTYFGGSLPPFWVCTINGFHFGLESTHLLYNEVRLFYSEKKCIFAKYFGNYFAYCKMLKTIVL